MTEICQLDLAGLNLFSKKIAPELSNKLVFITGEMGTGKTTLVQFLLAHLGIKNLRVTSPTYALLHEYKTPRQNIAHLDLYRLSSPHELEFIGIRDYLDGNWLVLIEWPEKAQGFLPEPDVSIKLAYAADEFTREIHYSS